MAFAGKTSFFPALLLLLICGCARKPAQFRQQALQAETEARQAFERHDPEAASQAADRAALALSRLQDQVANLGSPELKRYLDETWVAAQTARSYARRADEERQCREHLASLKVTAYRKLRGLACQYGLGALAPAAEHLATTSANHRSQAEQPLASVAWTLLELLETSAGVTNPVPDWQSVATKLRAWQTNPPPDLGLILAPAFELQGAGDFALCEIEAIDPTRLGPGNARAVYHIERSLLFALRGWDETASCELQEALALGPGGSPRLVSTQALGMVHIWLASNELRRNDTEAANRQLARAHQVWPQNPLLPVLQSDLLACQGNGRQAAALLESSVRTISDPWLARRLNERALQLRQPQSQAAPLISDRQFLLTYTLHAAGAWLRDSALSARLEQLLQAAQVFGEHLAQPAEPARN